MGNAVVERHVPVAVRQVDHVWQQGGRGQAHSAQVGPDGVGLGVLLTGHPEPLLVERHQDLTLWRRGGASREAELASVFFIVPLSSFLNNCFILSATLSYPPKPKDATGETAKKN